MVIRRLLVLLTLALAASVGVASAEPADVVLRHGAVYTVNPRQPWAQAVAVSQGRIVFVGPDSAAAKWIGPHTRVIDLGGRMMLPGFHDAHVHLLEGALALQQCHLNGSKTVAEVEKRVRAYARKHPEEKWVIGGGWDMALFPDGNPKRQVLDALVPDRPAVMWASDGHNAWANTRALQLAGIDAKTPDPPRGRIEREADGTPSGALREEACDLVDKVTPPTSAEQMLQAALAGQQLAHQFGIVSVQEANSSHAVVEAWRAADRAKKLQLRVVNALKVDASKGPEQVDAMVEERAGPSSPLLRATAAKIFMDGVLETYTAGLLEPYADRPGDRGKTNYTPEALDALVTRLDAKGFQIHFHVIGDRSLRMALDALQAARKANGKQDHRHHLAHLQVVNKADVARFVPLGATANFESFWMQADVDAPTDRRILGAARFDSQYPVGWFVRAGVRVVGGSDWPVSSLNPLDAIEVAVTHLPLGATSGKPHVASQRIALADAIAAYTRNGAWLDFNEKVDGTIEPGKAADLIVLDRNLFRIHPREIHTAKVVTTMLQGRVVYQRGEQK